VQSFEGFRKTCKSRDLSRGRCPLLCSSLRHIVGDVEERGGDGGIGMNTYIKCKCKCIKQLQRAFPMSNVYQSCKVFQLLCQRKRDSSFHFLQYWLLTSLQICMYV